jgi:hypothetical protein
MPTTRRRRAQPVRAALSPAAEHYFLTGRHPAGPCDLDAWVLKRDEARLRALWREYRTEILEDYIAEHPGRRPWAWWRFDAPEMRRRLGGIGTPAHEVLAYAPEFDRGIPIHWVQPWQVEYYSGRAVGVHGQPIGTGFLGRDFAGVAIDPDDPPIYESEAAFLDRRGLLDAEERARLDEDAFEPEEAGNSDQGRIGPPTGYRKPSEFRHAENGRRGSVNPFVTKLEELKP